jgi:superfamily II DNA or RNA helicase
MDIKVHVLCFLAVDSGKTVMFAYMARESQLKGNVVWFIVHRKELVKQTLDTFKDFNIPMDNIFVLMVRTAGNQIKKNKLDIPKPDFIIFDECNFSLAKTWKFVADSFPEAYRAGLTATPVRLDGKPLGELYDDLVIGISARELTELGYLADYDYYAPLLADISKLKRKGHEFDQAQATDMLSSTKIYGDVIKHYNELAKGKQAICYCPSVKYSEDIADQFVLAGINAVHFDGNTNQRKRDIIVERFKRGDIQVLCNVDLISVGFDVPDCECCILLRPTMSTALYIQQAMRCLRPKDGKKAIIIDHVGNYNRFGLPTDDREWSLTTKTKAKSEFNTNGEYSIRQCESCFRVFKTASICPHCGWVYITTQREIEQIREVKLKKIKESKEKRQEQVREQASRRVSKFEKIEQCHTLQECIEFAKLHGYSHRYGYVMAKKMGVIR